MQPRIHAFQSQLAALRIDAYLVMNPVQVSYLTGYPSEDSWLLVSPHKTYYCTDARYYSAIKTSLKDVIPFLCRQLLKDTCRLIQRKSIKRLGFDEAMLSLSLFKSFKRMLYPAVRLCPRNYVIERMREIKDEEELNKIRSCLKINQKIFDHIERFIKPGLSEQDILERIDHFVRARKARFSFSPIVASGPNSAFPHARVTERKLLRNDVLLVDVGIELADYKSDLTRMFFLGKITPLIRKVYDAVALAQKKAIAKIKTSVRAADVDLEARKSLKDNGLAKYFCHSLGHGVGREIHESPRISPQSDTVLKPGMVITVEPGVYLHDQFGIRIEDMVCVTDTGCEILSR